MSRSSPARGGVSGANTPCCSRARVPRWSSTISAVRTTAPWSDAGPAQQVVDEIVAAGGRAVANTDNVADWAGAEALVAQAVRGVRAPRHPREQRGHPARQLHRGHGGEPVDAVIAVHLKGHAATLHHAAAYWKGAGQGRGAGAGRGATPASASGTFMPTRGRELRRREGRHRGPDPGGGDELERYGVRVNAIAPIARTRLTLATPGMGALFAAEVPEASSTRSRRRTSRPSSHAWPRPTASSPEGVRRPWGAISELINWHGGDPSRATGRGRVDDLAERLG